MKITMTAEVVKKTVTATSGKNAGKTFDIQGQVAYAEIPDNKYPRRIEVPLEKENAPYPVGDYTVSDKSFLVGRFDKLELGRLVLEPVAASVSANKPKAA